MGAGEIMMLERALNDLINKWERFFAGVVRQPPIDDRDRLARNLRRLSESQSLRSADRFRCEQLQHRFMTYAMNWERMLREREEGRGRSLAAIRGQRSVEDGDTSPPASVHSSSTADASLYDRYVAARASVGDEVRVDRATFEAQIAAQRERLAAKLGPSVRFDVKVEGGKVKVAASRARAGESRE